MDSFELITENSRGIKTVREFTSAEECNWNYRNCKTLGIGAIMRRNGKTIAEHGDNSLIKKGSV